MQELYYKNVFTSVMPFVEECIQSTCLISGGSPNPRMDGKKMANLLEESYRMPKPQHVDEKLYEKIVLLLVLLLFFYVLITVTFIFKVLLMKVACVAQN